MIGLAVELAQLGAQAEADICHEMFAVGEHLPGEDGSPVLGDKHQVHVQRVDGAAATLHVQFRPRRCHGGKDDVPCPTRSLVRPSCQCSALRLPL